VPDATHLVNLANDLLPGANWLARMLEVVRSSIVPAVIAFNDGIHPGTQAAHFCADMSLLKKFYPDTLVPLCYDHMFGDTEITERAKQAGCYTAAPWAVLYHNHIYVGNALDDIYKLGHAQAIADQAIYQRRRANGWRD
jgi:GT2 family glycosyltransferase